MKRDEIPGSPGQASGGDRSQTNRPVSLAEGLPKIDIDMTPNQQTLQTLPVDYYLRRHNELLSKLT
jgi:hypothetical protein